jgi:hypothetical protein
MDSMENFRERFDALEQRTEQLAFSVIWRNFGR